MHNAPHIGRAKELRVQVCLLKAELQLQDLLIFNGIITEKKKRALQKESAESGPRHSFNCTALADRVLAFSS